MAAELTQGGDVVYSPRTLQVWRALLNWLGFFFQIFLQILRALGHLPLLSSSSSSSSPSFKPLPNIELPEHDLPAESAVHIAALHDSDSDDVSEKKKLTVLDYFYAVRVFNFDFNSYITCYESDFAFTEKFEFWIFLFLDFFSMQVYFASFLFP